MTATEIEQIANAVKGAAEQDQGLLYILISVLIAAGPVAVRYLRNGFKKEVESVVEKTIEPIKDLIKARHEENEKMFTIMQLHIDELTHVKKVQQDHSERITILEK